MFTVIWLLVRLRPGPDSVKDLLSHKKNTLSRKWSSLVRQIFHRDWPGLSTWDTSCYGYNCQATCHSCFKLPALAHSYNHSFCLLLSVCLFSYFLHEDFFLLCPFLILLILSLLSLWFLLYLGWLLLLMRKHCWYSTTLVKAQGSCHLFLAFLVPAASNTDTGI